MENFRKMSNTTEAFMFELLRFFMRPYRMKWDMNGRSPYLEGRRNVALETVAHHDQLFRLNLPVSCRSRCSPHQNIAAVPIARVYSPDPAVRPW